MNLKKKDPKVKKSHEEIQETLSEALDKSVESTSKADISKYVEHLKETTNLYSKSSVFSTKHDDFLTAVNKPSHYQGITITGKNGQMTFEAIEIIDSIINMLNFSPAASHAIGDALKYQLRCGKKESDNNTTTDLKNKAKQDLLKASWYLTRASDNL